jgi:hypothetical protein
MKIFMLVIQHYIFFNLLIIYNLILLDEGEKILHLPQRLRIFDNFQTEIHHNGKEFPSNQVHYKIFINFNLLYGKNILIFIVY